LEVPEWSWRREMSDRERGKRFSEDERDQVGGGTVVSSMLLFQRLIISGNITYLLDG
jgi:hypothetical protein